MQIVIDANVLFSALIKDSFTRQAILTYDGFFLFPSYIFEEMEEHKAELMEKSNMTTEEFNMLLQIILTKVMIVPNEVLDQHFKESMNIVKLIDPDDAPFIACALAYPGSIFWSDDKRLKRQTKVKVVNSKEISSVI
jgi:predicted nucleic acid-binding protein